MNIGDKVRFLNDVGGGKVIAFRPGGIVLVEDEDGFDVPVPQNEVVVIEEDAPKSQPSQPAPKIEYGTFPVKETERATKPVKKSSEEQQSLNGKEYLMTKTVAPIEEEEIDENLEARIVRLEMALQKLEARVTRLEAENNLRKNEKLMSRQNKQHFPKKQEKPAESNLSKNIEELQIL